MSLFDIFRGLWAPSKGPGRSGKAVYILDAGRLADTGGRGDKISPRDQVQVLQQLARFAKQEGIRMQAVFEGKVLREVEDGGEYSGVAVFFADKSGGVPEVMIRQAKQGLRRGSVTVVTSDRGLEEKLSAMGANIMRVATLRKGMEGGGAPTNGGDRPNRPPRYGGRRQRPMHHSRDRDRDQSRDQQREPQRDQAQPSPAAESQPPSSEAEKPTATQPSQPSAVDTTVRNLIDLVE